MAKNRNNKQQQAKQSDESLIKERARKLPLSKCYINATWKDLRIAHIVVSRGHINNNLTFTILLVDLALYGVKDVMYRFNAFPDDLEQVIDNDFMEFVEIPYELAHNIVFSALEWAEDFGFMPARGWKTAQYILDEDTEDIPLIEIECGIEGKPAIFHDTAVAFKSDVDKLMKTAGEGNFRIFYENGDEGEVYEYDEEEDEFGVVGQIIEDDIEQFLPEYYNEDVDFSSKIEEVKNAEPAAQIAFINKIYFEGKGWKKFETIDLIDYTIGDKDISLDLPLPDEQKEILDRITNNRDLFNYDELLKYVKQYPETGIFYNLLFGFLHDDGIDDDAEEFIARAEDLYHAMNENLYVTAFYLFELINKGQIEKYREMLEQTNFIQKVLNYRGDIPDIIFIYYCCIRSLEELNNNNLEEADIYYFASRLFTADIYDYICTSILSGRLVVEKVKEVEKLFSESK